MPALPANTLVILTSLMQDDMAHLSLVIVEELGLGIHHFQEELCRRLASPFST
jgi:hypothetical protein